MKIESRGKYPGVKLHLDEQECLMLNEVSHMTQVITSSYGPIKLLTQMQMLLRDLLIAEPKLLEPRSPAQIKAELQWEIDKSQAKLHALAAKKDWTTIKMKKPEILKNGCQ